MGSVRKSREGVEGDEKNDKRRSDKKAQTLQK